MCLHEYLLPICLSACLLHVSICVLLPICLKCMLAPCVYMNTCSQFLHAHCSQCLRAIARAPSVFSNNFQLKLIKLHQSKSNVHCIKLFADELRNRNICVQIKSFNKLPLYCANVDASEIVFDVVKDWKTFLYQITKFWTGLNYKHLQTTS